MFLEEKKSLNISLILTHTKKNICIHCCYPYPCLFCKKKKKKVVSKVTRVFKVGTGFHLARNFETLNLHKSASITGTGPSAQELEIL